MPGVIVVAPPPEVYCTSRLSPKRLPKKKNESPMVVISCKKERNYQDNIHATDVQVMYGGMKNINAANRSNY